MVWNTQYFKKFAPVLNFFGNFTSGNLHLTKRRSGCSGLQFSNRRTTCGLEEEDWLKKNIYIFIWLRWVSVAARGTFIVAYGLSSRGVRAPEGAGPVVMLHRLSYPMMYGDLSITTKDWTHIPALQGGFLTTSEVPGLTLYSGKAFTFMDLEHAFACSQGMLWRN